MKTITIIFVLLALALTAQAQTPIPDRLCINDPQHGWLEIDARARTFRALMGGQEFAGPLELFEPTPELEYVMVNANVPGFRFFSNLTWKRHASFARVVMDGHGFEMWNRDHNDCDGQPSTADPWQVHIYPARPEGQAPLTLMLCAAPTDFATLTNYEWSINGVTMFGNMIPMTFTEPGSYTVKVKAIYVDIIAENEITVKVKAREEMPPNVAPTVKIEADRISGKAKKKKLVTVNLSAIATDQDGQVVSYLWRFSDGSTSTEQTARRVYGKQQRGTHVERVTVTDDRGGEAMAEIVITVR